jgi:transcriptional regulator GlxA family with amidase domain
MATSDTRRFAFVLLPGFSLIALGSALSPLRLANELMQRTAYAWVTIGMSHAPVRSSDGPGLLPDRALGEEADFDAVFVVGPNPIPPHGPPGLGTWLRRLAAGGIALGGIDTGSCFLARAGLLDGYRCTIHWEDRETLLAEFPRLIVTRRVFEIDRDRYTCSGGVSPLDMMSFLLSRPPGHPRLAAEVAGLLVTAARAADATQDVPLRHRCAGLAAVLIEALELMESNLEEPLATLEIARCLDVSRRSLERRFKCELGMTPRQKYLQLRLDKARLLVRRTSHPLQEIARRTGFCSASHLIRLYRHAHGLTPQADRERGDALASCSTVRVRAIASIQ